MILLWGVSKDGPLEAVMQELQSRGEPFAFLDQFAVQNHALRFNELDPSEGVLIAGGEEIPLKTISAVYFRPYESGRVLKAAGIDDESALLGAQLFDDAMLAWVEIANALVVNRPSAMSSNNSKPYQSALISAVGFDVPDTLITTDAVEAAEFRKIHGRAIYKSASGVRSKVAFLDDVVLQRLDGTAACPLQIQEYIPGVDFRAHVLEDKVFAARIDSGAADYRYPNGSAESPELSIASLPPEIEQRCIHLTRALGLTLSGIDLRHSSRDNRWICFEANPSPGYTYYEHATGAPITAALVDLMSSFPPDPSFLRSKAPGREEAAQGCVGAT